MSPARLVCLAALFSAALLFSAPPPDSLPSAYVLGPGDQIVVRVADAGETGNTPVRIDNNGFIRLPMIGRIKASGLTAEQLENEIGSRLKEFIKEPDVAVSIAEFRSQPVSVLGSVRNPGVHQIEGRKTLVEILSLAGGLSDDAGHSVKIARRIEWGPIPLASARPDATGQFSVAEVSLKNILDAASPADNILIKPNDVVSIPRAEMVYVTGQVQRAGGYVLRERETLSVLQVLALAGGLDRAASPQNARILRISAARANRNEIPVDLRKIMSGKGNDLPLQAEDILFVPASAPKKAFIRAAEAAVQIGTGFAIYRR